MIWLGWQAVRRKTMWCIRFAFVASVVSLIPVLIGCFGKPLMFAGLYSENPEFSFLVHFFLFVLSLVQSVLLLFANLASRKSHGRIPRPAK